MPVTCPGGRFLDLSAQFLCRVLLVLTDKSIAEGSLLRSQIDWPCHLSAWVGYSAASVLGMSMSCFTFQTTMKSPYGYLNVDINVSTL